MNFNLTKKVDYKLQHSMTDELINLYGIGVKLLLTEKINKDDLVFGDYSHLKTDSDKSYEIMCLPEITETWDNINTNFSQFGLLNLEAINLYFSRKTIDGIFTDFDEGKGFKDIIGNLLVLPNDRIIEIVDVEFEVPGINNLYTHNDQKNAYKFSCKTYDNKLVNEVQAADLGGVETTGDYTQLDDYFGELADIKTNVDTEAEVTPDDTTADEVVATDEDPIFGRF